MAKPLNFPSNLKKIVSGFTLAELLIALAVLGVIATFTIPKILTAQTDQNKKAIFKETIASINAIMQAGMMENAINETNFGTYVLGRINATKICSTSATAQGCFTGSIPEGGEGGFVLANGAVAAGLNDCCVDGGGLGNAFSLDWNGSNPPNVVGDDQLYLYASFGKANAAWGQRPGTIGTRQSAGAANDALFQAVFQN